MGDTLTKFIESNGIKIQCGVAGLQVEITACDNETICYKVSNTPICQYDQHSRARIGAEFSDYKVSDNPVYAVYTSVFNSMLKNKDYRARVFTMLGNIEIARELAELKNEFNLMTRCCSYKVKQTWGSLKGQMARRLKFCEEEFIVGLHWLLRHKIMLYSNYSDASLSNLLPGCDYKKECDYSTDYYLSNMFGCLFAPCGRWHAGTEYATFNESCTNIEDLQYQLGINIPEINNE